jgi:peptide/nickel transport system ATP-binding protein
VSAGHPVLQAEGLTKRYVRGGGLFGVARIITAVNNASFSVAENEFVALVGESGSGKSTTAKMLVGLEQPSDGRILLNGADLTDPILRDRARRARSLQMVFQDPQSALNPRRRVASIVTQAMNRLRAAASAGRNSRGRALPPPS